VKEDTMTAATALTPEVERPSVPAPHNPGLAPVGAIASALAQVLDNPVSLEVLKKRRDQTQAFFDEFLIPDEPEERGPDGKIVKPYRQRDYGITPGTKTIALHLSAGQKLKGFFQVFDRPRIAHRVEDWDRQLFHYEFETDLLSRFTGEIVATGMGSCNSRESKYAYRIAQRTCPACGAEAVIKGAKQYGGGWLCFKKKNGCGEKFVDTDERITEQTQGRVPNEDICDQVNTFLRMGKKRAFLDAIVQLVRACGFDVEAADDESDDDRQGAEDGARGAGGKGAGATPADMVSPEEQKRIADAATANGHAWPDVVRWVQEAFKVDLTRQRAPKAHYEAILARVSQPEAFGAPAAGAAGEKAAADPKTGGKKGELF